MTHLYLEIAESIRRRIVSGDLAPGGRLPSVRSMAETWQCTPGTVSRAYQELARQGLVGTRQGGGTRVLEHASIDSPSEHEWALLVNRADRFFLEAIGRGFETEQAQTALSVAVARWRALQLHGATPAERPRSAERLRFAGSHDLSLDLLAGSLRTSGAGYDWRADYTGSLAGLMALARDEVDVAGVHLWDAATNVYNLPFVERILPGRRLALVTLARRRLGLMLPPGNPQEIRELGDLGRPDVRWINRQFGSGTRVWLDEQLQRTGVKASTIKGYDSVATTHLAVAVAVQSGKATAGLGIQAAAIALGLDFIPLTEEEYQLVVPEAVWQSILWQALLEIIRSPRFKAAVQRLGGYDTDSTGEAIWV